MEHIEVAHPAVGKTRVAILAAGSLILAVAATPVAAEDARQILEKMMERHEQRMVSVESVTIVQEVMGIESTTRLEKRLVDGKPTLMRAEGNVRDFGGLYTSLEAMAQSATLEGTETVDGVPCWVIEVEDLGGMNLGAEGTNDFESKDGTLYIDKKDLVPRRMEMNGVTRRNGPEQAVSLEMSLQDYRDVDGWLHPFLYELRITGEGGAVPAEIAEVRKAMAQMKEELAKMPAEQRQMMEQMMRNRMPDFEQAVDGDAFKVTVTVKEIRVNEPAGG